LKPFLGFRDDTWGVMSKVVERATRRSTSRAGRYFAVDYRGAWPAGLDLQRL